MTTTLLLPPPPLTHIEVEGVLWFRVTYFCNQQILRKIPSSFPNFEEAVMWHVKTGAVRSAASASVVVPSRLKDDGEMHKQNIAYK